MSRPEAVAPEPAAGPVGDRPLVGVSACLTGAAVRYDGRDKYNAHLYEDIAESVAFFPVCPEVEMGLGVPRPPIHLQSHDGAVRLVEEDTNRDLTAEMTAYAEARAADLARMGLAGFIFKAKSPSCGLTDIPVAGRQTPGRGLFAATVLAALPDLPAVEAEDLADPATRSAFLKAVFARPPASRRLGWHRRLESGILMP